MKVKAILSLSVLAVFSYIGFMVWTLGYDMQRDKAREAECVRQCYQSGQRAYYLGIPADANPNSSSSHRNAWLNGYMDAKAESDK